MLLQGDPPDNLGGLYIRTAQTYHDGTYTCIAKTQVDSANATATLRVLGMFIAIYVYIYFCI